MELRQLRYFVRVVELGSIGRAAADLQLVQSALSQQISRLEGELATRLLQRSSKGVTPTEAGVSFFREAQLALRHADQASRVAQHSRLAGVVKVAFAPSICAVLGLPFLLAMRERYPNVSVRLQESFHLGDMLNARQIDLGVLYHPEFGRGWAVQRLLSERLFLVQSRAHVGPRPPSRVRLASLRGVPLVLAIGPKGLRSAVDAAFERAGVKPVIALEVDSLSVSLQAIAAGVGAGIRGWGGMSHEHEAAKRFHLAEIVDRGACRVNYLCSLSDGEMSPAALGARVVLAEVARDLVRSGRWQGVDLEPAAPPAAHHES